MERDETALGLIETRGLTAAIEAADAMVKAADVRLIAVEQTVAALMTAHVVGEVAAVQAAVEAGRRAAERVGQVISVHVIPRPDGAIREMQGMASESAAPAPPPAPAAKASNPAPAPAKAEPPSELDALTVRQLRNIARETEGFPLQGRAVARANKSELIRLLKQYGKGGA